jgi:hypothetical protein
MEVAISHARLLTVVFEDIVPAFVSGVFRYTCLLEMPAGERGQPLLHDIIR